MKCSTVTTLSALASFDVELACGTWKDQAAITLRETEPGNLIFCEGFTNRALRDAVLLFVRSQESHKNKPEVRRFLTELSEGLAEALKESDS